jgi:hypothetical protein
MGLANSLKKVAGKAISKFGGSVTVTFVTASAYDTSSGTITTSSSSDNIKGVLEDVNQRDVNELVRAGDKRLTVAAQDLTSTPETNDRVLIGGVVHQIIQITTQELENTAITYELFLRA